MKGSIEIPVNREIRSYKETIFYGFTMKQVIFGILGLAAGAVVFLWLPKDLNLSVRTLLGLVAGAPMIVLGFLTFNNMTAAELIRVLYNFYLKNPRKYPSVPTNRYANVFNKVENQETPNKKGK